MPVSALVLVLTAAVLHAMWNFAARGAETTGGAFVVAYWLLSAVLLAPVVAGWAILADPPAFSIVWIWAAAVSGVLHLVYGVVLQRGYAEGDLSLVYPVARGVGPLVTLLVAVSLLGERPGAVALTGALVVVAGIAVISVPTRTGTGIRAGLGWGGATGLSIAAYTLWDAHSVVTLDVPALPYFAMSAPFAVLPLIGDFWRRRDSLRPTLVADRWRLLTVAALSPAAYLLVLAAMRQAPVALVAATRESSIVIGTALGVVVLGEPGGWRRALGAVTVLIGIGLVALG